MQTLLGKDSISQVDNNYALSIERETPAESGPLPKNLPSMITCVTKKSKFDDQRAFVKGKGFWSLSEFVQAEYMVPSR